MPAVRWHYRDAALLWLFVPAYLVHVGEEWLAGFPRWIGTVVGRPLPESAFLIINGIGLVLLAGGIRAAIRTDRYGWVGIAITTIVLVNTCAHAAGALLTGSYSPGLISAVVLYVPLGLLAMIRAVDQAPHAQLSRGIVAGLLIHALVFAVAFTFTRIGG
jgi:Protein of unknown function with HXXEE motif